MKAEHKKFIDAEVQNSQKVYLCVMRGYNHYYDDDDNSAPLWEHLHERFVAANSIEQAENLLINRLNQEEAYVPPIDDRKVEVVEWTGQWQDHYSVDEFLRLLITDPESKELPTISLKDAIQPDFEHSKLDSFSDACLYSLLYKADIAMNGWLQQEQPLEDHEQMWYDSLSSLAAAIRTTLNRRYGCND